MRTAAEPTMPKRGFSMTYADAHCLKVYNSVCPNLVLNVLGCATALRTCINT